MASKDSSERFETVIIGAGQAGLGVGYHLSRQQRSVLILDANGRIGDSWRKRWDSLQVFTPAQLDGLPGWSFPASRWTYPTKDDVADYLESYAARFQLPVRNGVHVDGLAREAERFVITSGRARYEADNVVVATGGYQSPRIPVFARELDPNIVQLHSSDYRNPSQLHDGAVLVVGAGNSGAEIALEVSHGHQTWLAGRDTGQEPLRPGHFSDRLLTPLFWLFLHDVLSVRTPVGRKARQQLSNRGLPLARVRRKDLIRAGVERRPRVAGARDGLPMFADGVVLEPANVIWCTGFVPDFSWIDLPIFDRDGELQHARGVVHSEPGLYFMGLFFMSAGSSSLIGGVSRDAQRIAREITSRPARGAIGQQAHLASETASA